MSLVVVLTVGDNIGHSSQSPVCTSKNMEIGIFEMKNSNKMGEIAQEKNRGWCPLLVMMMLGNALRV